MMRYWRYLDYVVWHKWYVGRECWRRGLYWRGLVHDWSKLLPDEFFPYADHFGNPNGIAEGRDKTGYYKPGVTGDEEFDAAWIRHSKRNQHHWQYWAIPDDGEGVRLLPMPRDVVTEMVCDWIGAAKAQHNSTPIWEWFRVNRPKMQLHPVTERRIVSLLDQMLDQLWYPT